MVNPEIQNFFIKVFSTPRLYERSSSLSGSSKQEMAEQISAIASEEGFHCPPLEIIDYLDQLLGSRIASDENGELSDDALESVAGGKGGVSVPHIPWIPGAPETFDTEKIIPEKWNIPKPRFPACPDKLIEFFTP